MGISAQSSLNGQTSSDGQLDMEVWHPVNGHVSDAEGDDAF